MSYQYGQPQNVTDTNPSCRQLMMQPPVFAAHWQAPYPQQLQRVPPGINNALPFIANSVGTAAGATASANPVYVYFFNLISQNGFRNQFFEQLVEFTARYFLLLVEQRATASEQEALQQSVEFSLKIMAASQAMQNPILRQFVDPGLWSACMDLAQRLPNIVNQFNNGGQQQPQAGYGGMAAGGGYGGGYAQPTGVVVEPFKPVNVVPNPQNPAQGVVVEPFVGRRAIAPPAPAVEDAEPKFFAIPGQPKKEAVPAVAAKVTVLSPGKPAVTQDVNVRVMGVEPPVDTTWRPFPNQLFKPAYDSNYQDLVVENQQIVGTKTFRNIAFVISKENPNMNRADHAITTAQQLYRGMARTEEPRVTQISSDLDLTARAIAATELKEDDDATKALLELKLIDEATLYTGEDSLVSFVTTARLQRHIQQTTASKVFTVMGSIVTNFVTDRDLGKEIFDDLANATDFATVAQMLTAFTKKYDTEQASALVWRIDRFLQRELLHVIRKRMGLSKFWFDSFIDDHQAIMKVLEEDWGVLYTKALAKFQSSFVKALFDEKHVGCDEEAPLFFSMPRSTVTLLDIDAGEFGVKINDDVSHEVFPSNFPGLYEFITAIVNNNENSLHHYIVTEDDVIYEVHKSIVGDNIYLISNGPQLVQI